MQFKKEGLKLHSSCKKMQPKRNNFPQNMSHFTARAGGNLYTDPGNDFCEPSFLNRN